MDATSMPNFKNLIANIQSDYPELSILPGERFQFSPPHTIYYENDDPLLLLHEVGHYLLPERKYASDIELIRIESRAWAQAESLCARYGVDYDPEYAEDRLDSYRDWLHFTSLCKNCDLAGYQDVSGLYHCALCGATWNSRIKPE